MEESHRCIRTSFEYQILDSIRVRLNLPKKRIEAPMSEIRNDGTYLRHCRLLVRTRNLVQLEMPYYMYIGLDLSRSIVEVYTNGVFLIKKNMKYKKHDKNAVYAVTSLHSQKSLTRLALRELIMSALQRALIVDNQICMNKPLYMVDVTTVSSGPYILTAENKM
jgi:hypothetical protein